MQAFFGVFSLFFAIRWGLGLFRPGRIFSRRLLVRYGFCFDVPLIVCAFQRRCGLVYVTELFFFLQRLVGADFSELHWLSFRHQILNCLRLRCKDDSVARDVLDDVLSALEDDHRFSEMLVNVAFDSLFCVVEPRFSVNDRYCKPLFTVLFDLDRVREVWLWKIGGYQTWGSYHDEFKRDDLSRTLWFRIVRVRNFGSA